MKIVAPEFDSPGDGVIFSEKVPISSHSMTRPISLIGVLAGQGEWEASFGLFLGMRLGA